MLIAYTARYVFPVTGPLIEDGVVVVEDGRIVQVGREAPTGAIVIDLNEKNTLASGGVALLPGLVNAHTHLEFSDLESPLGEAGMVFPDWIRAVIEHRRSQSPDDVASNRLAAIALGLPESRSAGTTTIGEIAPFNPWTSNYDVHDVHCVVFRECLGLSEEGVEAAGREVAKLFINLSSPTRTWQPALSPHAPYSTHWALVAGLCNYSRAKSVPLAMHLAESREELELLQTHAGPFRELLNDLGVWNPAAIPLGGRPLDYLRQLATAHRSLVIHGNYLDDEEIAFVAANGERMSIVYCPRTHAYFQHATYPLEQMLAAGVNVALGTDSRASNPDLSLLAEMRHVAANFSNLPGDAILRMGTINGANALGLLGEVGSLEPGKRADFAVVALPNISGPAHELLLNSELPAVATFIA